MKNLKGLILTAIVVISCLNQVKAQPTSSCSAVFDDFTNPALWTHPVLSSSISNPPYYNTLNVGFGTFNFQQSRDYNFNYLYRTGLTISDNDFIANIDFRHTSNGITAGGAGHVLLALNDDTEPFFYHSTLNTTMPPSVYSNHHGIAVTFESDLNAAPTDFSFKVYINNGGIITTVGTPISVGGPAVGGSSNDYFVQLVRIGSSAGILNIYSDATRTTMINSSGLFTIPSSIVSLNTVQFGTIENLNQDRMLTGKLDNLCIDNTSSANPVTNDCNLVFDDFSTPAIWAHPMLSVPLACWTYATMGIASGQFNFWQSRDNNFNYLNRPVPTISNTDFKADIDFTHTSNGVSEASTGGAGHTILALNEGVEPFFSSSTSLGSPGAACTVTPLSLTVSAQKGIAVTFESDLPEDPTNLFFKVYINDGSGSFPTMISVPISVGPAGVAGLNTNYYIRLERIGTTIGKLSIYSDSARTTLYSSTSMSLFTIPTTITNLDVVQMGGNEWQEEPRMLTGFLDNLCISNTLPLSTEQHTANALFKMFPNPVHDLLTIQSQYSILSSEIIDLNGRKVQTIILPNSTTSEVLVSTENLQNGLYFIKITTQKGSQIQKFLKK